MTFTLLTLEKAEIYYHHLCMHQQKYIIGTKKKLGFNLFIYWRFSSKSIGNKVGINIRMSIAKVKEDNSC